MSLEKGISIPSKLDMGFENHGLFSDHFLVTRLSQMTEWQSDTELDEFRKNAFDLFNSKKSILPKTKEAQTEKEFIQPMFNLLGYSNSYIVQTPTTTGTPDYALYPDETTKNAAYDKLAENDYSQCLAVADAKYWERELDIKKISKRDTFSNKNPSSQIIQYLNGTGKRWGVLTNGRLWRLYNRESKVPMGNYYQADFVNLLEDKGEKLKYFYLFFRKASLLTQKNGKTFLDIVLEGSLDYATELENHVKQRAFEVVQLICKGFATSFNSKQVNKEILKQIYDNSLTFLYRLLFVFYAEARELLPLTASQSYRDNYSMKNLTHKIEDVVAKQQPLSFKSTLFYQHLSNLFNLIDSGDTKLGIPEYNGGLFDPAEHPFLNQYGIPDFYLIPAVRHLAWIKDNKLGREVAIDYNTLNERHLGDIYEGLLEFKPAIAEEDLVVIKDGHRVKYATAAQYPDHEIVCAKNDLYLVNERGERKITGSYYTPASIVNYMVASSMDVLLKEAALKVKSLKADVKSEISKWEKQKKQNRGKEPIEKYDRAISKARERLLAPYLTLKILDPSMGSGHFLTRVADVVAEKMAMDPSIDSPPDLGEDSEFTYYRRRVVENCIYGVDVNRLAVELAKLTLWLSTMAKSKPLSFLNPHLKVGNSLIGAKLVALDEIPFLVGKFVGKNKNKIDPSRAPVQMGQFEWTFKQKLVNLLNLRALIANLPTDTLADVHAKKQWDSEFQKTVERFRVLAGC